LFFVYAVSITDDQWNSEKLRGTIPLLLTQLVAKANGRKPEEVLMNGYEVAVVYHPDLEMDLEKATSKVEKLITDNKGEITETNAWGKRKLAYKIKNQEFGLYVIYTVSMPTSLSGLKRRKLLVLKQSVHSRPSAQANEPRAVKISQRQAKKNPRSKTLK
jgi:ribosomal protein S6